MALVYLHNVSAQATNLARRRVAELVAEGERPSPSNRAMRRQLDRIRTERRRHGLGMGRCVPV